MCTKRLLHCLRSHLIIPSSYPRATDDKEHNQVFQQTSQTNAQYLKPQPTSALQILGLHRLFTYIESQRKVR